MKSIEQYISKKIGKAIYKYKMIENNDKILMAFSGGKDSTTLLYDLVKRQKSFPIKYEMEAVHIKTDFCTCYNDKVENFIKKLDVKYHLIYVPVKGRLKEGKKMNCYWCSTQRRIALLKLCEERGCNKIVLGHHQDDIIETLLMNMFFKAEMAAMLPVMKYNKFPYTVIRPMALVKEKEIIKFADQKGFNNMVCKCPYSKNSKRLEIRNMIKDISKNNKGVRDNIFKSMKNVNLEYLLANT